MVHLFEGCSGLHDPQIFVNPLDQIRKGQLFLVVQPCRFLEFLRYAHLVSRRSHK